MHWPWGVWRRQTTRLIRMDPDNMNWNSAVYGDFAPHDFDAI